MKKLILILTIFTFTGQELMAQLGEESDIPLDKAGSGIIFRNTGGADGPATTSVFESNGDWSTNLTISEKTPATAANDYTGPSHNGMGSTGWGSFAAGAYNRASGNGAFVGGFHNAAGPLNSSTTSIDGSSIGQTAFGYGTQATGNVAFAVGEGTTASGANSTAMGENTVASGTYSTAIGFETDASDYGSLVIGQYNSSGSSVTSSATAFNTANTAFVIGNGTSGSTSDAFKVLFSGNTTVAGDITVTGNDVTFGNGETISNSSDGTVAITATTTTTSAALTVGTDLTVTGNDLVFGNSETISNATDGTIAITATTTTVSGDLTVTGNDIKSSSATAITLSADDVTIADDLTVTGDVNVSSDARLKSNIISLGSTLSKLLLIDGKTYTMKKDGDKKIGVLAQDIQKVFPELVSEDDNQMLAVNYQGLVPVLINAIKEQEDKITRLENLVEQLINNEK
tara:strand:+ start:37 stop:1407 length:1371 start_codon:yes stop_codon:yes gene_type:complete